jgi:hypothetical protein
MRAVMGKERPRRARPRAARAGTEATARRGSGRDVARRNVSDWRRLTEFCSKFLNRSAQSGK